MAEQRKPQPKATQPKTDEPTGKPGRPFISEGTAQEIEMHGKATDPTTGRVLTKDDLPAGRKTA